VPITALITVLIH